MMPTDSQGEAYIPSFGPGSRPRRTLKHGDTFAVLDSHGEIGVSPGGPDGIFHLDTRYLSLFALSIDGRQPLLLGSNVLDDNLGLVVDLTNPDIFVGGELTLPKDTVHLIRFSYLWDSAAHERISVQNHGSAPVAFTLSIAFDNDFADLFEVRGMRRKQRGTRLETKVEADYVVLGYRGLDAVERHTTVEFRPRPERLDTRSASYRLQLAPGERVSLFTTVTCLQGRQTARRPFLDGLRKARRTVRQAQARGAAITTSNQVVNHVIERSVSDLYMLVTETPQGPYPYAGIPWYSTTFGRDGLLTAIEMLWLDPEIARGVLGRLAALQARERDPAADAEPGKILHEMRSGEMAALHEVPFGLYYGSVDATPLFVLLAGLYYKRTGDRATLQQLWPAIEAALAWIDGPADIDGDGFIEYYRATESGLANQGWKDSFDAVFHADGRLAEGPIALVEVQAYVFAAKQAIAKVAKDLGHPDMAQRLRKEAARLAAQFEDAFWCEELGTYALALDGAKKQCRVSTSNAGHVLFAGLARPDRAASVAERLLSAEGFSGWGIRTVALGASRYNPMSYHNGSVWPHDNAVIALGLSRYGFQDAVARVTEAIFGVAAAMDLYRLPELFCGFRRKPGRGPTLYPVACAPQAWAGAAVFALVQACLGIDFEAESEEIQFRNPRLPRGVDQLLIQRLTLGGTVLDALIQRQNAEISVGVTARSGGGQAVVLL